MARRLIINADDLGLSPSVNTAIFDVFRAGNLTSATLMVDMPGAQDAVERLKDHPGLAVGLHFCITEGRSRTGPSTLTDGEGAFLSRGTIAKASLFGRIDPHDVRRELESQLARMRAFGLAPTHADSHQHVHMLPVVMDAVLPVLEREGLAMRIVAPPRGFVGVSLTRPTKALKQWLNGRLARYAGKRARLRTNDLLVSIHDLDNAGPYGASTYAGLLENTPDDSLVEVMVHPYILGEDVLGMYSNAMAAKRPFLDRCLAEYEALRGEPVFSEAQLISYGTI